MELAEDLKKAVLQAAMQGKLTKQLESDSSVDELLKKIADEKAKLIAEGKIKKERGESLPLSPARQRSSATPSPRGKAPKTPENSREFFEEKLDSEHKRTNNASLEQIPQEEIPFEIPENWRWTKLGLIGDWGAGATPDRGKAEYYKNGTIPWIKTGELNDGIVTTAEEYITELAFEKCSLRMNKKDDVLIAMYGATIGKVAIAGFDLTTNQACCACTPYNGIFNYYLFYFLKANKPDFVKQSAGGAQPNISRTKIVDTLFPLPPIEEQQRIVEKLNQILPLIDEYGKEEDELITLCQKFPEEMKKSVLQSAMQGKLTKQLETDSSVDELLKKIADEKAKLIEEGKIKKEKPLAEITEEEIPFDIPENWRWERWENLSNSIQYGYNASAISSGFAKMVRISDIQGNKILWDSVPYCEISESEYEKYKLNNTDILFARTGGTVGKSVLVSGLTERSVYAGYLIRSHYNHNLNPQYLKYFMECPLYWNQLTQGTTKGCQPNCNGQTLSQMIVPLPPIEEQQRIVEKLNTILPIIGSMAVYGTKKKAGRPKQEEALAFISSLLGTQKSTDSKSVTPEILELTSKAKEELPVIVKKYADLMGVTYNRITIRHQKTRWGSCTKTGNLSFNCLILKMPETVRNYVIIHELAHRKELNHSTKFWTIVAEYCPWYKEAKQWLKENGQSLMELK